MNLLVWLSPDEIRLGARVGKVRLRDNLAHGRADRLGQDSAASHARGAIGEVAGYKGHGIPLDGFAQRQTTFARRRDGDLPNGVEVRTTRARDGACYVKGTDPPDRPILLVWVPAPPSDWRTAGMMTEICGWIIATEAVIVGVRQVNGDWAVPQAQLHPGLPAPTGVR